MLHIFANIRIIYFHKSIMQETVGDT